MISAANYILSLWIPGKGMTQEIRNDKADSQKNSSSNNNRTPAEVCASYDLGGGVRLGHAFAICSTAALSFDWNKLEDELRAELVTAASNITDVLPVHISFAEVSQSDFVALPCCTSTCSERKKELSPLSRLPWYLINAGVSRAHCIAGQNSVVESLLIVLQRPWCVLEVCCCEIEIVVAAHKFVSIAEKIDPSTYHAASLLLSHEIIKRTDINYHSEDSRPLPLPLPIVLQELLSGRYRYTSCSIFTRIREIYHALSIKGLRSHNPFWLCLICVCAIYLDITFWDLVRSLRGEVEGQDQDVSEMCLHPTTKPSSIFRSISSGGQLNRRAVTNGEHRNIQEYLGSSMRLRKSVSYDSFLHNQGKHHIVVSKGAGSVTDSSRDYDHKYFLVSLYESILRRTGESVT